MKKNIIVGVCAGIASYKTCELVRLLIKDGFRVKVVMTEAATKFVSPLVFQTLSNNPVYVDMFALIKEENPQHIDIAQWASLCVIAPLSANLDIGTVYVICGKFSRPACGITITALSISFPLRSYYSNSSKHCQRSPAAGECARIIGHRMHAMWMWHSRPRL